MDHLDLSADTNVIVLKVKTVTKQQEDVMSVLQATWENQTTLPARIVCIILCNYEWVKHGENTQIKASNMRWTQAHCQ